MADSGVPHGNDCRYQAANCSFVVRQERFGPNCSDSQAAAEVLRQALSNPLRPDDGNLVFFGGIGRDDRRRTMRSASGEAY